MAPRMPAFGLHGRWPSPTADHPALGKLGPPASTSLPGERGASFWFGHHLPPCCGRAQPSSLLRVAANWKFGTVQSRCWVLLGSQPIHQTAQSQE